MGRQDGLILVTYFKYTQLEMKGVKIIYFFMWACRYTKRIKFEIRVCSEPNLKKWQKQKNEIFWINIFNVTLATGTVYISLDFYFPVELFF